VAYRIITSKLKLIVGRWQLDLLLEKFYKGKLKISPLLLCF